MPMTRLSTTMAMREPISPRPEEIMVGMQPPKTDRLPLPPQPPKEWRMRKTRNSMPHLLGAEPGDRGEGLL